MKAFLISILLMSSQALGATGKEPVVGIYRLTGSSTPKMEKAYKGKVVIEKVGDNYRLTWLIGPNQNQTQRGVGLLESSVLSVSYVDMSGRDFGVVAYKVVNPKKLEGRWTPIIGAGSYGLEYLEYEGPAPAKPAGEKKPAKEELNL